MIVRCSDSTCGVRATCLMWEPGPSCRTLKQGPDCKHMPCGHYQGPMRCAECGELLAPAPCHACGATQPGAAPQIIAPQVGAPQVGAQATTPAPTDSPTETSTP